MTNGCAFERQNNHFIDENKKKNEVKSIQGNPLKVYRGNAPFCYEYRGFGAFLSLKM
jgi:hypothetical protein